MRYLIEGHWEKVDDLHDISRIIREYYNPELANEMDELIPDDKLLETNEAQLEELEGLREIVDEIRALVM